MAITRAQQAKQMLQNGGMLVQPGFGGTRQGYRGDDAYGGGGDKGGNTGGGNGGSTARELGIMSRGKGPKGTTGNIGDGVDRTAVGPESEFVKNRNRQQIDKMLKGIRETVSPSTKFGNRLARIGLNVVGLPTGVPLGEVFAKSIDTAQTDIFGNPTDEDDGDRTDRGEGEYIAPTFEQRPMISEPETTAPVTSSPAVDLNRVAYRLMADGGAVMDDEPRQAYGLGSIVKKAARAVKKVAKSDIGKAAIAAAGVYYLGGGTFGGLRSGAPGFSFGNLPGAGFFKGKAALNTSLLQGLPSTAADRLATQAAKTAMGRATPGILSGLSLGQKAGLGIAALSALPLLGVGVEEDEEEPVTNAYLGDSLDIAAIRANPRKFQGQAYRLMAEGGDTEDAKEPVAKKVMPLIDMDGKEKDYRETGGFVDIGRMEKADDVPARLSKNEFVFTADAVRNAGDGSVDKGAEVMYNMMKNLEAGGEVSEESQGLKGARKMFQTSQRLEEVL